MDKVPARHKETWWRNDDVSNSVSKRWKLCKEWKQGSTSKEKYLEAKNRIKKNCLPGKLLFNGTMKNVFKIAERTFKTNQDVFVEQYIRNDDGV